MAAKALAYWTPEEDAILREEIARSYGYRARVSARTGRSGAAVKNRVRLLGIARPGARPNAACQPWTPGEDALIRAEAHNGRGYIKRAGRQLPHRSFRAVMSRASILGVHLVRRRWTREEIDLLEALAGRPINLVASTLRRRGYRRSKGAIAHQYKTLGISTESTEHWTADQLGALLSVHGTTVCRWIHRGYLKARRGPMRYDIGAAPRNFIISRAAVKDFLTNHIPVWGHEAVPDPYFLVEILTGKASFAPPAQREDTPAEDAA